MQALEIYTSCYTETTYVGYNEDDNFEKAPQCRKCICKFDVATEPNNSKKYKKDTFFVWRLKK